MKNAVALSEVLHALQWAKHPNQIEDCVELLCSYTQDWDTKPKALIISEAIELVRDTLRSTEFKDKDTQGHFNVIINHLEWFAGLQRSYEFYR